MAKPTSVSFGDNKPPSNKRGGLTAAGVSIYGCQVNSHMKGNHQVRVGHCVENHSDNRTEIVLLFFFLIHNST